MSAYKVAIVRLSSLGDVVVSASLLANARALYPQIHIDWIVDSSFSAVLESSPSIDGLIAIALKKGGMRAILPIVRQLRALGQYDMVIDMQGLIKSAIVARMLKARAYWGFRRDSVKEPLASIFYTHKIEIAYGEHILKRNAKLLLSALAWLVESGGDSARGFAVESGAENRGDSGVDSSVDSVGESRARGDSKTHAQGGNAGGVRAGVGERGLREALESSALWELCSRRAEVFGASEGAHRRAEEILAPLRSRTQGALESAPEHKVKAAQGALEGKIIVLILEASLESKAYPVGLCVELVRLLVGANVLLLGHTSSKAREIKAHFTNEARVCELPALSLDEVKALLLRADLVIGGDTGITHLAWALGRDSITLYGNTPPARFALQGERGGNRALCGSENPSFDKNDFSISNITPRAICECAQAILRGRELC